MIFNDCFTSLVSVRNTRLSYKLRCYTRISSPENSRNNIREKNQYFFTCKWFRKPAADTSLAFRAIRSGGWLDGKVTQSKVVSRNFLVLWLLKHWKIRISYRQWRFNISRRWRKPKYEKTNRKLHIQWLWLIAFLAAENKNRQPEVLSQARFGPVPDRFLLSVRTKSVIENFLYWILRPLLFLQWFNACFHLECANALYDFHQGIVDSFIFIH